MTQDRPTYLLTDAIVHHATYSPRSTVLVCDGERLTWSQFELQSRKLANALIARGVKKGDRVCMFMPSSVTGFISMWGIARAGGVIVALNIQLRGDALAQTIDQAAATLLLVDASLRAEMEEARPGVTSLADDKIIFSGTGNGSLEALIERGGEQPLTVKITDDDSFTIVYSSGSTGKPKGIEHTHGMRKSFSLALGGTLGIVDRHAVTLITTPLYTNGAWITLAPTIFRGGTVVVAPKFTPEIFLSLIEQERCTHAWIVPTQSVRIVACPEFERFDVSSLKVLFSAGLPLLETTYQELLVKFPGVRLFEAYGMSEGFGTVATPEDFANGKRGSVGKAWFLDDIAILGEKGEELPPNSVGEIAGWSAGMMKGYFNNPELTAESTWTDGKGRKLLRSGDLGYFDEDGFLYVSGRLKDMIKTGGINVFSSDIEAVFIQHPQVREVAVLSIPHAKWGETPLLLAILQEGATITEAELKEWGNTRLAKFQRVDSVEFREDFERAQYGKPNKAAMREPYWADHFRK